MTIDYSAGVNALRTRRLGLDRADSATFMEVFPTTESYERRSGKDATRYALGAMQEVAPDYTKISLEEAEKVQRALEQGLANTDISAVYRLQGSVPLNVHIRGYSDVDLLVIISNFLTYSQTGALALNENYSPYTGRGTLVLDLMHLREECEEILERRYYGAKVDTSGKKSIHLSGGGFRREVDVVPAHWHDDDQYQNTKNEIYRTVAILDKSVPTTQHNWPFLYIHKIELHSKNTNYGTKMAIRLLKNLKSDSNKNIELSSYDIGSIIFHCPEVAITSSHGKDLSVLAGAENWLTTLASDLDYASTLKTPDGSRFILDTRAKRTSLIELAQETTLLSEAVYGELATAYPAFRTNDARRRALNESYIPPA